MTRPVQQALDTLREAQRQPRFLFASENQVRLGVGIFRRLEESGPDQLRLIGNAARQLPKDATVFGGFAFDMATPPRAPWEAFPTSLFVVPALEWEWDGNEWGEHRNGSLSSLPRLPHGDLQPPRKMPWETQVATALSGIRAGKLSKVVLARNEWRPALDDPLEAFALLAASEPDANLFYFEPIPGHAFFGATPERLVRLHHGRLETHAVAGTASRGDKAADAASAQRLLSGGKESLEHRLVVEHIVSRLEALGLNVEQGMRKIRRMATVQHLETQIGAQASAGLHLLDAAAALHPTPAVCGTPVDVAKQLIDAVESTPRGWYSGGVGWFDHRGEGEILVALRAALATPDGTWVHAGAGIVEGSDAKQEWDETAAKMAGVLAAVEGRATAGTGAAA